MNLLKKTTEKIEPVSREEFEALSAELESFKEIATLAIAAVEIASKAGPGMPDASPRKRFEALADASDLDPAERAELGAFLKRLDSASRVESQREFREAQERTKPRRPESFRPPSWRG